MIRDRIAVVDEENRFVRWETRQIVHEQRLPHRSVHVLIFDSAGRLLVQRRSRKKITWPGAWDTSCAGHVEEEDHPDGALADDTLPLLYAAVASRELREELGIDVTLEPLGVFRPVDGVHYEYLALYRGVSDGPFKLQESEVEEIRLLELAELDRWIRSGCEVVTSTLSWLMRILRGRA